jgi:trehalose synthase-fused probable maltokinase
MAPTPALDRRLGRLASAFSPEWLAAQRWFRGKSRRLAGVSLIDAAQMSGGPGWLLVLEAADDTGAHARYLVPALMDEGGFREPMDGDGVWRALTTLMLDGGELRGSAGRWSFSATEAVADLLPDAGSGVASLPDRALGVQQSNTSVALGDALILKVYRLVEPGLNPEIEMNAFLTEVGFDEAPALAGSATYHLGGEAHSAAMLQQLVPSSGDAWGWMLGRLADPQGGPAEAIRALGEVGRVTAAMHAALASRPETPGFPSRVATAEELASWQKAADGQLHDALAALDTAARSRLEAVAPGVTAGLAGIVNARGARVSRVHGDFHLGQLLRTGSSFFVIDFEGEPARSVQERRSPASPLRDVAGMLRSLDYAAQTAAAPATWLPEARSAFLDGYGGIGAEEEPLLAAFELEKACYEVVYEANNRPDWVWLPLGALERQAGG